jgi:Ca2+-binding RTX toxin-like protein
VASGYTNYSGVFLPLSAAYQTTITATGTATISAGAAPTRLVDSGQGNVLIGSVADDTLMINSIKDRFSGGAGIDTAISTVNVTLPSDVENLQLNAKNGLTFGIGNDNANIIKALSANAILEGMGGDDVLLSYGKDLFVFEPGSGRDTIYNFHPGATNTDVVRLVGYNFYSFSDVTAAMTQVGADVKLQLSPTDLILFKNTTVSAFTAADFQLAIDPTKLKLTFADEFGGLSLQNKSAGGGIWGTSYPWDGYNALAAHNIPNEREVYVDPQFAGTGTTALGLNPFSVNNGVLTITASPTPTALKSSLWNLDYTSGLLTTKGTFAQTYGYFEMRADLPEAKGAFPAFWLLPADGSFTSEIDIMEAIGEPNWVYNTVHWGPEGAWTAVTSKNYIPDLSSGFHTFGLLWTAQTLTWYIDGTAVASVATPAECNKPMYMLANYAVGGAWAGDPVTSSLPGMQIDYIHAYSLDAAPVASPTQGTSASDTLTGTAGPDTMYGGAGNDVYFVGTADCVVEQPNGGIDTVNASVSYALPANVENLTLTGTAGINGTGNSLNNVLTGNSAGNVLTGGGGTDTLIGGAGSDIYVLNSPADLIVENPGGGSDTVDIGVSYTLPANVENLSLTGSSPVVGTGNALDNKLVANGGADTLLGGAGADTLIGGGAVDSLVGGTGNDTYILANNHDKVTEAAGEGTDTVTVSYSYTLGANLENLTLTGSAPISGTGNNLNNLITGNSAANTLIGGAGDDTLNGAAGIDSLVGGTGNDTYVLGSDGDVVVENAGEGTDTVTTDLNYNLGNNVENLTLTGKYAASGYGNALNNVLIGNGMSNRLEGRGGADTLDGGGGADTLVGGNGDDYLTGGAGNDVFIFNKGDGHDVITDFGNGADQINIATLLSAGLKPTLVLSGADTLIQFTTGDYIRLTGVLPAHLSATASGFVYV